MDQQEKAEVSISPTVYKLPPKIQEPPWKKLMKEIRQYGALRQRWRLGFIQVSRQHYERGLVQEICGYYHHEFLGEKCKKYLGETFEEAFECVDDERIGILYGYYLA